MRLLYSTAASAKLPWHAFRKRNSLHSRYEHSQLKHAVKHCPLHTVVNDSTVQFQRIPAHLGDQHVVSHTKHVTDQQLVVALGEDQLLSDFH